MTAEPPDASAAMCAALDADWAQAHRECTEDEDCVAVTAPVTCCTSRIVGVSRAELEQREACDPPGAGRPCGCSPGPTRADDGRPSAHSDGADVAVACVAGSCATRVAQRSCGDASCARDELCVGYARLESGVDVSYQCVTNPCKGELSCDCAESVCALYPELARVCAVEHIEAFDVSCAVLQR